MVAEAEVSRAMLEFARRWCPYGGGRDEDILVDFGLCAPAFFERILCILESPLITQALDSRQIASVRAVSLSRLGRSARPQGRPAVTSIPYPPCKDHGAIGQLSTHPL